MRSALQVLLVPLVSTAMFAGVTPALAEEPAQGSAESTSESVEGQGPGFAASDFGNALGRANGFIRSWGGNPISDIMFHGGG